MAFHERVCTLCIRTYLTIYDTNGELGYFHILL